jgi:pyruvate-formate lyase-activating enzyme
MPEHAANSGADQVHVGAFEEAEGLMPAYDLVPEWDGSIVFSSRGCDNRCPYCAVWRVEGSLNSCRRSIKGFVYPGHTRVILWDNNILQSPYWREVFDELVWFSRVRGIGVDFNQGLDARLLTDEAAEKLAEMRTLCIRLPSFLSKQMKR